MRAHGLQQRAPPRRRRADNAAAEAVARLDLLHRAAVAGAAVRVPARGEGCVLERSAGGRRRLFGAHHQVSGLLQRVPDWQQPATPVPQRAFTCRLHGAASVRSAPHSSSSSGSPARAICSAPAVLSAGSGGKLACATRAWVHVSASSSQTARMQLSGDCVPGARHRASRRALPSGAVVTGAKVVAARVDVVVGPGA